MKLSECLNTADNRVLRSIAEYYDFPCSRHSKMALIQEIMVHFKSPRFLAEQVPTWGQHDPEALTRLSMDPRHSFSAEDITAMFHCSADDPPIRQTQKEGWLFAHTELSGRFLYIIPEELQEPLRNATVDRYATHLVSDFDGPLVYQDEAHAMGRDLDVLLEYIRHHDVKLTADGSMYKRNLSQVLELLEVTEDVPQETWRFGYGRRFHDYPDRLALLYDLAYHRHFIEEQDDGSLVVTDSAGDWNHAGPLERARQLLRFYVSVYRRPITRLPLILQLLAAASPDWVASASMLGALGPLVPDYYYDDRAQVWNIRILKMLTHLGVTRCGSDEIGTHWFQITKLGQQLITPDAVGDAGLEPAAAERILIVQPNFDIVVTADQPQITAELAIYTDLAQSGMVRVYRLTEASMQRGFELGRTAEQWLSFLSRHAQTAVPGNVERMVQEWGKTALRQPDPDSASVD